MIGMCRRAIVLLGAITACLVWESPGRTSEEGGGSLRSAVSRAELEADWLVQARLRYMRLATGRSQLLPTDDATGGCDGVIDGKWGFHTALEDDPWWQIDLGAETALGQLRIYNRCDGYEGRAAHLRVLLSRDGQDFAPAYTHDGTPFRGQPDQKPLTVSLEGQSARFIRLQVPGNTYFHLDEVQVLPQGSDTNMALQKAATQSSVSQWSVRHGAPHADIDWPPVVKLAAERGLQLAAALRQLGVDVQEREARLNTVARQAAQLDPAADGAAWQALYFAARETVRDLALSNPLLDFDKILFVKRAPTMFPHMSDQYYGWWARPGGGLAVLEHFTRPDAQVRSLTDSWPTGNFLQGDLSYDARRVLFAFSQYDPLIANVANKRDKQNVPESVFYHLFEMDLATGEHRQLTRGKYDDFDGRYLPNGDVLFLSTRKGQFLQTSAANTQQTVVSDLPDSYVRCGGDDYRPVPVFTMHVTNPEGTRIWPVSAFETFEYTPSIAQDGRVLYCRWDYIDRFNGHFFSLWSSNPDGSNAQLVYGNVTVRPQATVEPRSIPNSNKLILTAAAHHSIIGGSLVLLNQAKGNELDEPLTRLTPEVPYPETEENVDSFYANPWPLSEDFYLVSWSNRSLPGHARLEDDSNPVNAQGIYLYDRFGNLELLHRDPAISSMMPIPLRPRKAPAAYAGLPQVDGLQMGSFLLQDVYQGLVGIQRGAVKRLRIVGVIPKVQPHMNTPSLGVSHEETGKFVLGTVPVEADGSAYFRVPSGMSLFFQALDADGFALQTMRSLTYVQPGQTLSCIGCHESRYTAPTPQTMLAMAHGPSRIQPDVEGTWPLRFDTLVQPVLDRRCASCHHAAAENPVAAQVDLSAVKAWQTLIGYAGGDLSALVFERDVSIPGDSPARRSKLLSYLRDDPAHRDIGLTRDDIQRLAAWMDTYGQTQGAFSSEQERLLEAFRDEMRELLE